MKRIAPVLVALTMMLASASAETVSIFCKPGDEVNIRTRANSHSEVCGRYQCGYTFETDGKTKRDGKGRTWVHMVNAQLEVTEAWVCAAYVQDSVTVETCRATVDARGRVAIRKTPGGNRVAWAQVGDNVTVYAYSNEWAVTDRGYISMDCLSFEGV